MALTVGILNIIEYLEGREAYQQAAMIRKGRETAKGVRVKKGENGFLTDTFSYEGKPHTKKVRLVWERLFCNGSGNCRRGCGGMGACIDGCPKGKQRAKGGHRCSFHVNLTLYSDNLNEWSVEFFGSHVHPVDVWTPPEKNMLRSPTIQRRCLEAVELQGNTTVMKLSRHLATVGAVPKKRQLEAFLRTNCKKRPLVPYDSDSDSD